MKASRAQIERLLDAGGGGTPCFLVYGPDESGSRAMVQRLARALGPSAERVDLDGTAIKADPARLALEAASMSLFGERRYIVVQFGSEDIMPAIDELLAAQTPGNPVILQAGGLKATSPVVKALLAHPAVAVFASYPLEERDFAELAAATAREKGLRIDSILARRLVALSGHDRAVLSSEIDKLALYLDADPALPKTAEMADLDAIAADSGEPELSTLTDAVFGGKPDAAAAQIAMLAAEGVEGITLIRALNRRLFTLIKLRGEMAAGKPVEGVTASLFFKEKGPVSSQLRRWTPERLATASNRLLAAERAVKASGSPGPLLAEVAIMEIARAARG